MIGNDIVDLKIATIESNWNRPRFLDKVFTDDEQYVIFNAEHPSIMVWLLWSMKEAAYKVHLQQNSQRFYNPKKLVCTLSTFISGHVQYNDNQYFTTSNINKNFIHTIAYLEAPKSIYSKQFELQNTSYKTQSDTSKKHLLQSFSAIKNVSIHSLNMMKDSHNIPRLFYKNQVQKDAFSISHHGTYGSIAIQI